MTFHTNAMNTSGQSAKHEPESKVHKKIYNPKSNRMIVINGPVYRKLLCVAIYIGKKKGF